MTMNSYQPSFFDESERYIKLDKLKDPLAELKEYIDFETFRESIEEVFEKPKRSNAGRKQLDVVFMFKILMLQRLYNLSDEQIEFQINDSYGHAGGDQVLVELAERLRQAVRDGDAVLRWGGEEFLVRMIGRSSALETLPLKPRNMLNQCMPM